MNRLERKRFDRLLERVLDALPPRFHELLDEAPLIVDDDADPALLEELGMDPAREGLCGLHSGTPLTERSVADDHGVETIHLFREGIVDQAGGWQQGDEAVEREIRITLLHEVGHHFGLEEDDLEALGYA